MKKKIIILVSIIIIITLITISVIIIKNNKKRENVQDYLLIKDNLTFEINTEVKNIELLQSEKNNQFGYKVVEENIDTSKLGKNQYTFKYTNKKDIQKEQIIEYEIVDKTSPVLEVKSEIIEIEEGTEINLLDNATATDNSKEELEIKIDGIYDINTQGEYKIKYVVQDSSENKSEKEITLKVNKKTSDSENTQINTINNNSSTKNNSNSQVKKPTNSQNNSSSNNQVDSNTNDEYDTDYLMKKLDQLGAEGRAYAAEIKQKVWTYVPNEINSHIPGATYPIYEADFYWQYVKYGTMEPGDGTVVDLYEWRVKSDMDEFRDVTGRPQMVHKNGAQAYLGTKPSKEGKPNEKIGNVHLYYTSGLGLYEAKKYIQAGR